MHQGRFLYQVPDQGHQSDLNRRIHVLRPSLGLLRENQPLAFTRRARVACLLRPGAPEAGGAPGNCALRTTGSGAEAVKFGSNFHQFKPICSALSTLHTSRRIRIVSNSTLANETRISPAMTSPLSSTRSRISRRLAVPETVGTLCIISQGKYRRDRLGTVDTSATHVPNPNQPRTNCQPSPLFACCTGFKDPEGGRPVRCLYDALSPVAGWLTEISYYDQSKILANRPICPVSCPKAQVPGSGLQAAIRKRQPVRALWL